MFNKQYFQEYVDTNHIFHVSPIVHSLSIQQNATVKQQKPVKTEQ